MGHRPVEYSEDSEEQQMLMAAKEAFNNKSYLEAEDLFKKLYEGAYSAEVRRMALYGFACTQFALAENDDELNRAYDLWYSWYKIPSENISGEDPRMMETVFEKIISRKWTMDYGRKIISVDESSEGLISNDYPEKFPSDQAEDSLKKESGYEKHEINDKRISISDVEASSSGTEIQYLLESREKEILKLRQQLGSMEKNIKSLKNQILAIEEIHQEIFEKKKGMRLR